MLWAPLLLAGLLGAAAGPVLGPPECTKGSAAWCRDLQAAARCGAVGHCQQAVWGQPAIRSLACNLCRHAAAAVAGRGLSPETPEMDVLASVKRTCEWLPSPESAARCQGMADTHREAVLGMLGGDAGRGPGQACAALTLCQPLQGHLAALGLLSPEAASDPGPSVLTDGRLIFHPPPPPPPVCQDCVQLVTRLQEAVRANVSLVEASLQEQCEPLGPSLALLCKNYLDQLSAQAEQTLGLLLPQDICGRGGFCGDRTGRAQWAQVATVGRVPALELAEPRKKSEVQRKASLTCEVCLSVVQQLDQWLSSNSTQALIRHSLEHLCAIVPPAMVQQCVTFVDTYGPSLVQLVTEITPQKLCTSLRLCALPRRARSLPRLRPSPPAPLLDEDNQGSFCSSCRRLFQESTRTLDQMTTRHDILAAFRSGCRILSLPYAMRCNHFVTSYEPVLLESLKGLMDPVAVCKKVGACHAPRNSLLGTDQCALGPSFWCRSPETAALCDAAEHCQKHTWREQALQAGPHA